MGIPNATAPGRSAPPLTRSPDVHNKAVQDYFVGAGLPASQIAGIHANASMFGSGMGPGPSDNGTFAGYTSVIWRSIRGIPVCDSFAWARFDSDGDVVAEGVYWPDISDAVIQQALSLQAVFADSAQGQAYRSKLPSALQQGAGQVAIRHSAGSERKRFQVIASYDVTEDNRGLTHHFDIGGSEFQFDSELPVPVTAGSRR
jgi:hypothetical protein